MSLPAMSYMVNGPIAMPHFASAPSISRGLAPSSSRKRLCCTYFSSMRLPMKPSQTPETTGTFFRVLPSLSVVASTSLPVRSEEHTSELQSLAYLVCRLLLEKKKEQFLDTAHCTCAPHKVVTHA